VIDLYMEVKMREQQRLQEANIARLLRAAKADRMPDCAGLRSQVLVWFRSQLVAPVVNPRTQQTPCK